MCCCVNVRALNVFFFSSLLSLTVRGPPRGERVMQNRGVIPLFIWAPRLGPNLCLYYPRDLRQTFIYWPPASAPPPPPPSLCPSVSGFAWSNNVSCRGRVQSAVGAAVCFRRMCPSGVEGGRGPGSSTCEARKQQMPPKSGQ